MPRTGARAGPAIAPKGHVRDCLTEVVLRELRVVPVCVLNEAVREVGDEQACLRCPSRRALGQVPNQAIVLWLSAPTGDERPWLGVARRGCPPRRQQQGVHLWRGDARGGIERRRARACSQQRMQKAVGHLVHNPNLTRFHPTITPGESSVGGYSDLRHCRKGIGFGAGWRLTPRVAVDASTWSTPVEVAIIGDGPRSLPTSCPQAARSGNDRDHDEHLSQWVRGAASTAVCSVRASLGRCGDGEGRCG